MEEERILDAMLTDFDEAMRTATSEDVESTVIEEPISAETMELFANVEQFSEIEQAVSDFVRSETDNIIETVAENTEASSIESHIQEEDNVVLEETPEIEPTISPVENQIPVNSSTLQIEESTSRFSGAIWYEAIQSKYIVLAGLGGIGSYVAFLLSRLHPKSIILYDDDKVEATNMSGQLYSVADINNYKVNAIYQQMKNYSNFFQGDAFVSKYTSSSIKKPIMICGFDNMEARKVFYNSWKECTKFGINPSQCLFIDGRLAAEEFQVFAIQGDDIRAMKLYEEEWLFCDSEAEETLCSYKQTSFMANMIGSVMVNLFVNFVANECDPIFPRDVPFLTTYDASTMYFKVEM